MSSIYHSGYGYSKILCEDVTSWFLNNFFPRHKIDVDIIHRGLKSEQVIGYCDVVGRNYRPRHFMIELQTDMSKEMYIKTLLHELTHLKQWVEGSLRFRSGKLCYSTEPVENWSYEDQPHEIEARKEEVRLYDWYMNDTFGVPDGKVAQRFSNRLCSPV
tara:strand:+ start:1484 stop:1960 length:477 start_codon:yes stop_codon:yes gene_type:complete